MTLVNIEKICDWHLPVSDRWELVDQFLYQVLIASGWWLWKIYIPRKRDVRESVGEEFALQWVWGSNDLHLRVNGGDMLLGSLLPSNFLSEGGLKLFGTWDPYFIRERLEVQDFFSPMGSISYWRCWRLRTLFSKIWLWLRKLSITALYAC